MSTGINVLRYSALGSGVFYGLYHQISLNSSARTASKQHEYNHKADQIAKAKEAFAKSKLPVTASDVISDPEDPKFDLEKWINKQVAES